MLTRPRVAVPVPTSFDPTYNAQSWPEYAEAVDRSGGEPIRIELGVDPHVLKSETLHAVLLPGSGADVNPESYGHPRSPDTAAADPERQAVDKALLLRVDTATLPLLAICFGLQSLNVHRGGTLVQHLPPMPVNHRAGRPILEAHSVVLRSDSLLGELAGQANARPMVNSSHHQAVAAVGSGLVVTARSAEDDVIEAVEDPSCPWLVGVQWHPERTLQHSSFSRRIFDSFIEAARQTR